MKRYISALCVLLSGMLLYTSCLKSDNDSYDVTVYDDMAITGFSLSTVNRYIHTTSKSGSDSIYKKTLTSTSLPTFTIDQTLNKIYNTDSLPKDCDLKHVLATISSSTYSGDIVLKTIVGDTLYTYSSSDSIDFTQSREIRVYNNSLQKYRSYEVAINQHKVETNKILWEQMSTQDYPADETTGKWEKIVADAGLGTFIGTGTKEAYAFNADRTKIMVSKDEGVTWVPDSIDGGGLLLPTGNIAFVSYPFASNDDTDYQLLVGNFSEGETYCSVWRKVAEYAAGSQPCKWVNIPVEGYNPYALPASSDYCLVYFHGQVLAISPSDIRYCLDGGITWRTSDKFALPADTNFSDVEATTDAEGALWLRDNDTNTVWRGILVE